MHTRIPIYVQCYGDTLVPTPAPISTPAYPHSMASGFGLVWVTLNEAARVNGYDPESGALVSSVAWGSPYPSNAAIGVACSSQYVLVTDPVANLLIVINPVTKVVDQQLPVGHSPRHVCVDKNDVAWVTNANDGTIQKIELVTFTTLATVATGGEPYRICATGDYVVAGDFSGNAILVVDVASDAFTRYLGFSQPWAQLADGDVVYVANYGNGTVYVFDLASRTLIGSLDSGDLGSYPHDLVRVDRQLWVTASGRACVLVFDLLTMTLLTTLPTAADPAGMCRTDTLAFCTSYLDSELRCWRIADRW